MTSQENFFHDVMENVFFIIFEMLNKRLLNRWLGIINKFAVTTVAECHLGMFGCRILKNGKKCWTKLKYRQSQIFPSISKMPPLNTVTAVTIAEYAKTLQKGMMSDSISKIPSRSNMRKMQYTFDKKIPSAFQKYRHKWMHFFRVMRQKCRQQYFWYFAGQSVQTCPNDSIQRQ